MARSKVEICEDVNGWLRDMQPLLVKIKIKNCYLTLPEDAVKFPATWLREARAWIEALYLGPFMAAYSFYKELPPEVWERYAIWGETDQPEVVRLKELLKRFRMAIVSRHRPDLFKRIKTDAYFSRKKKERK